MLAILSIFVIIVIGLLAGWAFIPHSFGQSKVAPTVNMSPPAPFAPDEHFGGQYVGEGSHSVKWADTEGQHLWAEPNASGTTVAVEHGAQSGLPTAVATADDGASPDTIAAGPGSAGVVTLEDVETTAVAGTPVCTMPSIQEAVVGTAAAEPATVADTTAVVADHGLDPEHVYASAANPTAVATQEADLPTVAAEAGHPVSVIAASPAATDAVVPEQSDSPSSAIANDKGVADTAVHDDASNQADYSDDPQFTAGVMPGDMASTSLTVSNPDSSDSPTAASQRAATAAAEEAALAAEMSAIAAALQAQSALAAAMAARSGPTALQASHSVAHMTPEGSDAVFAESVGPSLAQPAIAASLQSDAHTEADTDGSAAMLQHAVEVGESVAGSEDSFTLHNTAAVTQLKAPDAAFAAAERESDSSRSSHCSSVIGQSGLPVSAWTIWAEESSDGNAAVAECSDVDADVTVTAVTDFIEPGSKYAPAIVEHVMPDIVQGLGDATGHALPVYTGMLCTFKIVATHVVLALLLLMQMIVILHHCHTFWT